MLDAIDVDVFRGIVNTVQDPEISGPEAVSFLPGQFDGLMTPWFTLQTKNGSMNTTKTRGKQNIKVPLSAGNNEDRIQLPASLPDISPV